MKKSKKKTYIDPVLQAESWKSAVDRETRGMNEQKLNKYFEKELKSIIYKHGFKMAQ